jgi:hypothetical protein
MSMLAFYMLSLRMPSLRMLSLRFGKGLPQAIEWSGEQQVASSWMRFC